MGAVTPIQPVAPVGAARQVALVDADEVALVARYRSGEAAALDELLHRVRQTLVGFFVARTGDRRIAEDLCHDVLLKMLVHLDKVGTGRPVWPWVMTIAHNRLTDHYRRTGTAHGMSSDARLVGTLGPVDGPVSPDRAGEDPAIASVPDHDMLNRVLARLTTRQRQLLLMHHVGDWGADDLARLLGCNRNAIQQSLVRARKAARREYQRMTGQRGPWALLPWPLLLAYDAVRRIAGRARRTFQEWQLALPAVGESVAAISLVAAMSLGAGAGWLFFGSAADGTGAGRDVDGLDVLLIRSASTVPTDGSAQTGTWELSPTEQQPDVDLGGLRQLSSSGAQEDADVDDRPDDVGLSGTPVAVDLQASESDRSARGVAVTDEIRVGDDDSSLASSRGEVHVDCTEDDSDEFCDLLHGEVDRDRDLVGDGVGLPNGQDVDERVEAAEADASKVNVLTDANCGLTDATGAACTGIG